MSTNEFKNELQWVSLMLRLLIGSLFLVAAITKLPGSTSATIGYYESLFKDAMLPMFLVKAHASIIMFLELALGAWLISGYRLKVAWIVSTITLISLAMGMLFVAKYEVASDNYLYALASCFGLLVSRFDHWVLAAKK